MQDETILKLIADLDHRVYELEQLLAEKTPRTHCKYGHVITLTKSGKRVCKVCRRRQAAKYNDKEVAEKYHLESHSEPNPSLYHRLKEIEGEYNREHHSSDGG